MAIAELLEHDEMIDVDIEDEFNPADFLRNELIRRLHRITDTDALTNITDYLDSLDLPEDVYILTPEEEQMIAEGEAELDAGLGIPYEEVHREIQEWLNSLQNTK
jgi:predicted transcriptional regulator